MVQMDLEGFPSSSNEEFVEDGLECVKLKFVRDVKDIDDAPEYAPEYVYQHFGDSEKIFGYKNLKLTLVYSEATMKVFPIIQYDKKINEAKEGVKADDLITKLKDQLPEEQMDMQAESIDAFRSMLAKEDSFKPYGELISKFTIGDNTYEVYKVEERSPESDQYLTRVQTLALLYIHAAEYTEHDDKWINYFVYSSKARVDGVPGNIYSLAGYASVYRFYGYPEMIRPRMAQMLLLPAFRGCGLGASFLKRVQEDLIVRKEVRDTTVEDPADGYKYLRDYVDCITCSTLPEFAPEKLKGGFTEEMFTAANKHWKICKQQCRRVYEILRLRSINKKNATEMKEYSMYIKRRLGRPFHRSDKDWRKINAALDKEEINQIVASELSEEDKNKQLDQLYESEVEEYKVVIERMERYPHII